MINSEDNVNYKITQGDTFSVELQYVDENDNPVNIQGYTFKLEVRDKPAGKIICATCSIGDGIVITDEVNGLIDLTISTQKTRKFTIPQAAYQLQATTSQGSNVTWMQGWFKVNPGVID
jgi:phage/plasmid primase-like uncharacterized protein